ncbi:Protein of unknown function [Meinhardsimonia xiamenensis]|jgi:hypothetical protein|uniref:DUF1153 domain-containing protein n=1 Tax=Meinhardsimonia xiamenensis TaxID=990712 RepID=A0A1G9GM79_9RHOB|nr:DUF1153 domain-containing protein [Meinhardsimonia xiamenensis]PRX30544.1 uncharacterized protein DUF1153 [Meinhardsimonia xiamenensis]SDL01789.1 Protein of unknown function [Meinhardsimonia xiamenensis]
MYVRKLGGPRIVRLPDGSTMSRADLPPKSTRRWVARRKAAVVRALRAGLISREEALSTWDLSEEELESWCRAVSRHGEAALKATAVQKFRQPKVDGNSGRR